MYNQEDFDNAKTKMLKYIIYKKRTEKEIRTKFQNDIEEGMLEDIIEYLKEAKYIDDYDYIEKAINEYEMLKNLSNMELKYKLTTKGLDRNLIEDYFYENQDKLTEYEIKSAKNLIRKKNLEEFEMKAFLKKKGYKQSAIQQAYQEET